MTPLIPRLRLSTGVPTLSRALTATAGAPFSYPDAGASRGPAPQGYRAIDRTAKVGQGAGSFTRLCDGILDWDVHRTSGVSVLAGAPLAAPGVEVALATRTAGIAIVMTCRVLYVLDQPRRKGFAYGTLPGHPEAGEETFVAEISDDEQVTFAVGGFSRPGTRMTAAVAPGARLLADQAIYRYLVAARKIAR
jgi:uncharacterized protein (UPF0548 family)